ncbi:response regulator [Acidiluteibacter ferrifornacis]|uniref:Response regulator n=1 Tax=Acidiluteibacter ferrifornacis TaxID=2692424 RepID=A0A6N9NN27_9FLAO|nr:response regulator [Acidiluteibacter ferrifornacis]MBR9831422.1 response regulator [bacterium]NBG67373.1 response regulator [Acidiluteibacter ferrifornacis]
MQTPMNKTEKLFIVDDDALTANLYAQHLKNLGYEDVQLFDNGQDCLNALIEEPTIILLDHQMENLSGMEVLQKVKRFDPNIYVVFISGQEDIATAVDALKYGAFDYIIKGQNDLKSIEEVLVKIKNVNEMLNRKDPGFFRKIISLVV